MAGSKFDGTGLEKLQIVQTHVAWLAGGGFAGPGLKGLSVRGTGEAALLFEGMLPTADDLDCREDRFVGFGISVTFADDLINPAYR